MVTHTFSGMLSIQDKSDYEALFLGNEPLAEILEEFTEQQVSIRYWVSPAESTREEMQRGFYEGVMGLAYITFCPRYSELTGFLWLTENLNIGGHDLLERLSSNADKWLLLEIDTLAP